MPGRLIALRESLQEFPRWDCADVDIPLEQPPPILVLWEATTMVEPRYSIVGKPRHRS